MSPFRIGKFFWFVRRATGHCTSWPSQDAIYTGERVFRKRARNPRVYKHLLPYRTPNLFFCVCSRCFCIVYTLWCSIAEPLKAAAWYSTSVSTTRMWRTAPNIRPIGYSRSRRVKRVGVWVGVRYLPAWRMLRQCSHRFFLWATRLRRVILRLILILLVSH